MPACSNSAWIMMAHSIRFFCRRQPNSYGVSKSPPNVILLAWQPPEQKNLAQHSAHVGFENTWGVTGNL